MVSEKTGPYRELTLINSNLKYVLDKIPSQSINIVDIGPGNSFPSKQIINTFLSAERLNDYIVIDISQEMMTIAAKNVKEWFGINTKQFNLDFEDNIIRNTLFSSKKELLDTNLCVYFGSTLSNSFNRLTTLSHLATSLGRNDYLWVGTALDTKTGVDKINSRTGKSYDESDEWIYKLLGIDSYVTTTEYIYNPEIRTKTRSFSLKQDLLLEFEIKNKKYSVPLEKDREIQFFQSFRYTLEDIIRDIAAVGLTIDQYSCYYDNSYGLFLLRPLR